MLFSELCKIMEKVLNAQGSNAKKEVIVKFLQDIRDYGKLDNQELSRCAQWMTGKVFSDARGLNLHVAEKQMQDIPDCDGDKKIELHICELSNQFVVIADQTGKDVTSKRATIIVHLLGSITPLERKYLRALILEQMPVGYGISTKNMIDAIADAYSYTKGFVADAYAYCGDIGKVAKYASLRQLDHINLTPFIPIKPMLAEAFNIDDAIKAIQVPFIADTKYDGARCQAHKVGDKIKLFSRNLEDITEAFPDIVNAVKWAFKDCDVILDGEIVAVKGEDTKNGFVNKPLPFQYVQKRLKRKKDIEQTAKEIPVCYYVFDLLWHNGENLMVKSLEDRENRLLDNIEPNWTLDTIAPAEGEYCCTESNKEQTLRESFKMFLDQGHEGMIVKDLMAPYHMNARDWIKIKAISEKSTALDTLDLAIIDIEMGTGKYKGLLGSVELGCKYKNDYMSLGSVGTGFTDEMRKELTQRIKDTISKPDLILVEVAFEEIQRNAKDDGYALRFPRFIRIRDDKNEPDSIDKVVKMYKAQKKVVQ